jgi:hypothetical protein
LADSDLHHGAPRCKLNAQRYHDLTHLLLAADCARL